MKEVKIFVDFIRRKKSYVDSQKFVAPQWYFNKNETIGARPKDKSLTKGIIGLSGVNNLLYYVIHKKDITVNHSKWYNSYMDVYRMKKKSLLRLKTLQSILLKKKTKKDYSKLLPFKNTVKMYLDSMCPILPPIKKCSFITMDSVFEQFALEQRDQFDLYNDKVYGGILPNGGWEFAKPHLKRYGINYPHKITYEKIFAATDLHSKNWFIPVFKKKPKKEDIDLMYVKPHSYSGLMTAKLFGSTKRQSFYLSNIVAKKLYDLTGSSLLVDTSLKTVGGREKLVEYSKRGENTVTRCVIQEETCVTQLKQLYARPTTLAYKIINKGWEDSHGIGANLLGSSWDAFVNKVSHNSHKVLCGDWSSHDTFVNEKTMIVAFAILRAMWPDSKEVDRHFFFFTTGHVYKRVVVPGGFVYRIDGGIMSGCPFTSHLNTICCKIEILLCFHAAKIKLQEVFMYGDDWIATVKLGTKVPDNFDQICFNEVGIKMKDFVIGKFHGTHFVNSGVSFLQTYSYGGEPGREFNRIVQKLRYCDNKSRRSIRSRIDLVCNLLVGNVGNERVTTFLLRYLEYLSNRGKLDFDRYAVGALVSSYTLRHQDKSVLGFEEQHLLDITDPDKYFGFDKSHIDMNFTSDGMSDILRALFGARFNRYTTLSMHNANT
jgi:hypothetical protein